MVPILHIEKNTEQSPRSEREHFILFLMEE